MMSVFIGRFHPVFVHLPIGILLFAALLFFTSKKQKFAAVSTAVAPALVVGSFFSILSSSFLHLTRSLWLVELGKERQNTASQLALEKAPNWHFLLQCHHHYYWC